MRHTIPGQVDPSSPVEQRLLIQPGERISRSRLSQILATDDLARQPEMSFEAVAQMNVAHEEFEREFCWELFLKSAQQGWLPYPPQASACELQEVRNGLGRFCLAGAE